VVANTKLYLEEKKNLLAKDFGAEIASLGNLIEIIVYTLREHR
jgi:hypothetical protein